MPTIRAIRPTDLVSLVAFFRHESPRDVTAHLWPEVGEKAPGRFLRSITSLLLARPGSSQLWLYLAGGIRALVVFQPRAGKLAWDVQELFLAGEDDGAGIELLEHIAGEAAGRGARKLFLATPVEDSAVRLAGKSGFANYTAESLYCLRGWPSTIPGPDLVGRLRLRRDTQGIFQLYNAAVPCRVRSAEAMTLDEWIFLEKGSTLWSPSLAGNRRHFVWESDGSLVAWLQVSSHKGSLHADLLVHPSHHDRAEEMLRFSLSQADPRFPLFLTVRDYQGEVASAAARLGFLEESSHLVFARELAVRIPSRVFVPARA